MHAEEAQQMVLATLVNESYKISVPGQTNTYRVLSMPSLFELVQMDDAEPKVECQTEYGDFRVS